MKITNLDKGEAYNLKPGTKIEVERTNPFFNDYGEQTVPLELPASEHNRRLLGFPGSFGSRVKMKPMSVSIQDGDYFATCRQIVLSAQYNGSIATSFYINDGSFYSRIQNVRLKDVFRDEFIPGVSTVEEGIDFCRRLRANTDDKFGIFPVLLADDSGMDTGYNYKVLNAYGRQRTLTLDDILVWRNNRYELVENPQGAAFIPDEDGTGCDFYNATERTEYVNQIPITLGKGYYISPFIRTNYLLRRIFSHFGYTLSENFFDRTEPFSKMVVVNNVIDVLVNGKIRLSDFVPNGTCADFLAVFRKKFCCEFTADEGNRIVEIVFLRDAMSAKPREDLTDPYVLELHCPTGDKIVNGTGSTTVNARVWQGGTKVEDEATPEQSRKFTYAWTKLDASGKPSNFNGTTSPSKAAPPLPWGRPTSAARPPSCAR